MKKLINLLLTAILIATATCVFSGCKNNLETITVGASSFPHADILEQAKKQMKQRGYDLQIVIYDDYVMPNLAVNDGQLTANYFQHQPYLDSFNKANATDIVCVEKIHYEPLGLYGVNRQKSGNKILVPSDGSNCTRALLLLQENGYVTLKTGACATDNLSDLDIVDLKGNVVVLVTADTVALQYKNDKNLLAVINGNYAIGAGIDVNDAIVTENPNADSAQTYANVIAVKRGNENLPSVKALCEILKSKRIKDYITATYNNAVKPIF